MLVPAFAAFVFCHSVCAQAPDAAADAPAPAAVALEPATAEPAIPQAAIAPAAVDVPEAPAAMPTATPMPFHFTAALTHSLGSGTFVLSPPNPTVSSTLNLQPSWAVGPVNISVAQRVGIEWTQGDGVTYRNQIELADTALRVSYSGLKLEDLGLSFTFGGGYNLPLSLASRGVGSVGGLAASARAAWASSFGFGVSLGVGAGVNLLVPQLAGWAASAPPKPYQDRSLGAVTPVTCNPRSEAELSSYACQNGGVPTFASFSPSLGLSYAILDGMLAFGLDLAYRQGFSAYVGGSDDKTPVRARTGLVPRQSTTGNLGVYYTPTSWFTLSVGAFSGQPMFAANGSTPRFPLWDFVSPYNNFSSIYVDTAFSF